MQDLYRRSHGPGLGCLNGAQAQACFQKYLAKKLMLKLLDTDVFFRFAFIDSEFLQDVIFRVRHSPRQDISISHCCTIDISKTKPRYVLYNSESLLRREKIQYTESKTGGQMALANRETGIGNVTFFSWRMVDDSHPATVRVDKTMPSVETALFSRQCTYSQTP